MIFHPKIQNPFTHTNYASPPGPAFGTAGKLVEVDFGISGLLFAVPLFFFDIAHMAPLWVVPMPLIVKEAGPTESEYLWVQPRNLHF